MSRIEDLRGFIDFPAGLKLLSQVPLDARFCGEGQEFLTSIIEADAAYPGLKVFLTDENKTYIYKKNNLGVYAFVQETTEFTPAQEAVLNSGITAEKVAEFEAKYDKPAGGIPESDLAQDLQLKIDTAASNASSAKTGVDNIIPLISSSATPTNQLLSASEVRQLVVSGMGRQLSANAQGGPFTSYSSLVNAVAYYYNGLETTPEQNDIATVLNDETHNNSATSYIWTGSVWTFRSLMNTSLSPSQMEALNSGINSTDWEAAKTKLATIEEGAEVNVIEEIQVNDSPVSVVNKVVKLTIPTAAADIGAQPTLVSGTNIKTVNGESILSAGNLGLVALTGNQTIQGIKTFDSPVALPPVSTWPQSPSTTRAVTEKEVEVGIQALVPEIVRSTNGIPAANLTGILPATVLASSYPNTSVGSATNASEAEVAVRLKRNFGLNLTGKATTSATVWLDGGPNISDPSEPGITNIAITGLNIAVEDVPTLNQDTTGTAAKANKLTTARKLKVDLSSTTDVEFDGSADVLDIPITGRLGFSYLSQGQGDGTRRKVLSTITTASDGDLNLYYLDKVDVGLGNVLNVEQASKTEFDDLAARVSSLESRGLYLGSFALVSDLPASLKVSDGQGGYITNPDLPNGATVNDFAIVRQDSTHGNKVSNFTITAIATDTVGTITWGWSYSYDIDISGKVDKVPTATVGNFASFVSGGGIADSTYGPSSFATAAQGTLADTAVQSIATGNDNGTILVTDGDGHGGTQTTPVAVKGLKSAAYTETSAYATAAQGTLADNAVRSVTGGTPANNGEVRLVVNTGGTTANVDLQVKGLDSAAYTPASAYATAAQGAKADTAIQPEDLDVLYFGYGDLFSRNTNHIDTVVKGLFSTSSSGKAINKLTLPSTSGSTYELNITDFNSDNSTFNYNYGFMPKVRTFLVREVYDPSTGDFSYYSVEEYSDLVKVKNRGVTISGQTYGTSDIQIDFNKVQVSTGSGNVNYFLQTGYGLFIVVERADGGKMGASYSS